MIWIETKNSYLLSYNSISNLLTITDMLKYSAEDRATYTMLVMNRNISFDT